MDNSIVDLEDDVFMVMVMDDEEEERSPEKPPAKNDEAGPSGTQDLTLLVQISLKISVQKSHQRSH